MITGDIKTHIDQIWNAFWTGGISNPLEVIEQLTYLLFLKMADEWSRPPYSQPSLVPADYAWSDLRARW